MKHARAYRRWLGALLLCELAHVALAQPKAAQTHGNLELTTIVEKIVVTQQKDGAAKTELVPIDVAQPGDEVVYTVTFKNVSGQPADDVRITNPIPPELRYVASSAFGPGSEVLYSVDGGRTYGKSGELTVAAADGSRRSASPDDYTHIRWVLKAPLDAGAKGFARFRAVAR
jgi:uncharacterized repeat protein (TIGR01451 family)